MKKTEFSSVSLGERYFRMEHKSGLPVYVFPKRMTTTFAYFAVRYGSLDNAFDSDGRGALTVVPDGIAHFLEHKMFENEGGVDSFARFAALGVDANAYTTYSRTAYSIGCTDHFHEALEELLRFVTSPHFTDASVKKEQGIIAEEIRMYEDNPWERCSQNLVEALYDKHPIRKNICGTVRSIQKITPELLYECYGAFYHPENMALIVCGDVDADAVMETVDRVLPKTFVARPTRRAPREREGAIRTHRIEGEMQVAKPLFCIGVRDDHIPDTPAARMRREMMMDLLDEILFSRSGSFYNELFEEGIISPSFGTGYSSGSDYGFFTVSGEANDPDTVLARLGDYLDRVRREGIDDETFARCKRVMYADEVCAYDSTEEIAGRLLSFVFDDMELLDAPAVLESIEKRELEEILERGFDRENFVLSVIRPLKNDRKKEGDR